MAKSVNGRASGAVRGRPTSKRTAQRSNSIQVRQAASPLRGKQRPLRDLTEEALGKYFRDLNGHRPGDLYELVLGEVEEPLFKAVMDFARGNQSLAAEVLGINRATLRKKLRHYQILN